MAVLVNGGEEAWMNEKPEIIAEPGRPAITLKRVFDAPRQRVFEALTKPENVKRWYGAEDLTICHFDTDFRAGGKWRVLLHASKGQDHGFSGEYREIVEPERLVQSVCYDGAAQAEALETLDLIEKDGKTLLTSTVLHTSLENRDRHLGSGMKKAATEILDRLADHLQSHDSLGASGDAKSQAAPIPQAPAVAGMGLLGAIWDWRKATAGALATLALMGGGAYWFLYQSAARYVTESVGRGSIIRKVEAEGVIRPRPSVPISAHVSGKIGSIYCDRDAKVKAGQLCAKVDPVPFRAVVDHEKADLAIAQARLKKDETRLVNAKTSLERNHVSPKGVAASKNLVDTSRTAYERAQMHATTDEAEIVRLQMALQFAESDLAHTEIVSSIDGTVAARKVELGQIISPSEDAPLFLVAPDLSIIEVDAKVSAGDVSEIRLGDAASFRVDTIPDRVFAGEVNQIIQSPQSVQELASRDVVINAANPKLSLTPGMKAMIQIIVDRHDNVIRVPDQSLRYSASRLDAADGKSAALSDGWAKLWILRNGKPTVVPVRLGLDDGLYTEVVDGDLAPGDILIVG